MRVVVDGWELLPPDERRGIGRYLENLLPELARLIEVLVVQRADEHDVPAGVQRRAVVRTAPRHRVRAAEVEHLVRLSRDLRRVEHDVLWSPGTLPVASPRAPWVQTLHDLAPLVMPGAYGWDRRRWQALGRRVRRAATVVTPSRASADEGMRVLGLDPARIEVIPHGVPTGFGPDGPRAAGFDGTAVVTVTQADRRKGLAEVLEVSAGLQRRGVAHRLHVVGAVEPTPGPDGCAPVWHGRVGELAPVLRAADVVVVTSRHEGFGFVPLEAMACGAPVVAFDAGAVGEVVGGGGVLVPDGDVATMVAEVAELLGDDAARRDLGAAAVRRAGDFTWTASAQAHRAVFDAVVV